jgi:hypothetical protein
MKTDLYKLGDIINSEGTIIGAFTNSAQQLYIGLFVQNHQEIKMVYIEVSFSEFKNYLQSKISLRDLSNHPSRDYFAKRRNNSVERIDHTDYKNVISTSTYSGYVKEFDS